MTISPNYDLHGKVVGASKIARDISAQRRAAEQQRLLLSEMKHRVRNSFAIASGLLRLSADQASTVDEIVSLMRGRFLALAAAHSLGVPATADELDGYAGQSLADLLGVILLPFTGADADNVTIEIPESRCAGMPSRRWRWCCTSFAPIRSNTVPCLTTTAVFRSAVKSKTRDSSSPGTSAFQSDGRVR